ncbi:MAG: hypothetical protein ACE5FL_03330 [Myxococcota bacterium]
MTCTQADEIDLDVLFALPDSPECRDFVAHSRACGACAAAISRRQGPDFPVPVKRRARWIAYALACAAAVIAIQLLRSSEDAVAPPRAAGTEASVARDPARAPAPTTVSKSSSRAPELAAGETLEIAAADIRTDVPFVLSVLLPPPKAGVEVLEARVLAENEEPLETRAVLDADDRGRAAVTIDGAWLARPGRYVVEVRTTELSHFPLRRYAIEVRGR